VSAWKIFDDDLVLAGNGFAALGAGVVAWLHWELPLGTAAILIVALFAFQCACLLSRYTAWIAALIGTALLTAWVALIAWLAGDHYHFAPIVCAVAGGLLGAAVGIFGYRELIQKIRPRPEKN
jgi:ABC-type enterochelin transport system permease subunit